MGKKLIAYECVAPAHQAGAGDPDKLTIHEGRWAFCGSGIRREGHEWRETGGEAYEDILHRSGLAVTPSER